MFSVHMGNFTPVDRDEIQDGQNQNGATQSCIVRCYRSLVESCDFTSKARKYTYLEKNMLFDSCAAKVKLFCEISISSRSPGLECSYGTIFIPVAEILLVEAETAGPTSTRLLFGKCDFTVQLSQLVGVR